MTTNHDGSPSAGHPPTCPLVVHHPLDRKLFAASHPLNPNTCLLFSSYPADTIFSDFTVQIAAARPFLGSTVPSGLWTVLCLPCGHSRWPGPSPSICAPAPSPSPFSGHQPLSPTLWAHKGDRSSPVKNKAPNLFLDLLLPAHALLLFHTKKPL